MEMSLTQEADSMDDGEQQLSFDQPVFTNAQLEMSLTQEADSWDNGEQQWSYDQSAFTDAQAESELRALIYPTQEADSMDDGEQKRSLDQPFFPDAQMESGLGPYFYKLPAELRFLIFGDCVASGHLQFMRASQALHNDGQALIFEKGVFRTPFGAEKDLLNYNEYLSPRISKMIRNVDITCHLERYDTLWHPLLYWTRRAPWLPSLQYCEVTLKFPCIQRFIFHGAPIKLLTHFSEAKKLVERVEVDKELRSSWKNKDCICTRHYAPSLEYCAVRCVQIYESLQNELGEGYLVTMEGLDLTFRRK